MSTSHSITADSVVEIKSVKASNLDAENAIRKLGPDSLMWRDFGTYLYQFILPQAFILQSAHPMVDRAVSVDKKYKLNPWGRAKDSLKLLWPVVYSKPQDAIDMGVRLRELHRSIKGTDSNGKKYHALDPEAYAFVHMTGYDALLRLYRYFSNHRLTPKERATLFEEWKAMGTMLGIIDRSLPQTEAEYWERYNHILDNVLEKGPVLDDLLDPLFIYKHYPRPPKSKMPMPVWKAIALVWGYTQHKVIVGTLPEQFRTRIGLRYNKLDQLLFNSFAWTVRTFYPMLPEEKQYLPSIWRIVRDAREHPQAYQL
ncbi:MAG: oxygenase MpaB family protein [Pseudomonadota bacterium]|nr:oxygenase MpaB family protein [Pseudomonadota bacterium]